ncbi:hypothetical protein QFZ96_002517 [Paraburkholderia youngii]
MIMNMAVYSSIAAPNAVSASLTSFQGNLNNELLSGPNKGGVRNRRTLP